MCQIKATLLVSSFDTKLQTFTKKDRSTFRKVFDGKKSCLGSDAFVKL